MDLTLLKLLLEGLGETMYMTVSGTLFSYLLGLPLGVALYVTQSDSILPNKPVNAILGFIVNIFRSVPFLILLITIMPFTKLVVGVTHGTNATVVPLVVAAVPFIGRMVEASLKEVDRGVIEASVSMGASDFKIITRVLLGEALPSLLNGATIALATILAYSAMAGVIGGGGLGTIAINYGYYRYQPTMMLITTVLLVGIVQFFQITGDKFSKKIDKRNI